jgi:hypothetical protein
VFGGLSWNLGVPTWLAAIGTVAAFVVAFVQINTERKRRHQTEAREAEERHFAQARLVSAMPGPEERDPDSVTAGRSAVDCINGSQEPVYNVVVAIVFIQGAAPHTTEDMLRLRGAPQGGTAPVTTLSILPPGRSRAWIRGTHWTAAMAGRPGAEIAFTDRAGAHWIRRAIGGRLEELPVDPLDYFARYGFHGPHDLQTPEPLP